MRIYLFANDTKPRAQALVAQLAKTFPRHGLVASDAASADVILALGGDGTILRAVHEFPSVPVLGLNLGGLGYLSGVAESEFPEALAKLADGRFAVSERTMLEIGGLDIRALNDIVFVREMTGHAAVLDLSVGGTSPTRYLADGIVIATPTGSTAYSLSAGGPVLMPDSASFVVTPMNPHALGIRPMVVSDSVGMKVTACRRAASEPELLGVYADGEKVLMLDAGDSATVVKAARGARLVELEGYDPYEVLSRKLGWSGTHIRS